MVLCQSQQGILLHITKIHSNDTFSLPFSTTSNIYQMDLFLRFDRTISQCIKSTDTDLKTKSKEKYFNGEIVM